MLAGVALPALGQDKPESILPPGFGEPAQPAPRPAQRPPEQAVRPADQPAGQPANAPLATVQPLPLDAPSPTPSATPTPDAALLERYELPASARRSPHSGWHCSAA